MDSFVPGNGGGISEEGPRGRHAKGGEGQEVVGISMTLGTLVRSRSGKALEGSKQGED